MKQGRPSIYHGALADDALRGQPDLLQRVDGPSNLGSFTYIPIDLDDVLAMEVVDQHLRAAHQARA